jgi:hypothetical protein
MDSHHAVVQLPAVAVVLSSHANRIVAALADTRFIHAADGFRVSMIPSHNLLATISQLFFIPLDRFEKTL